MSDLEVTPLPGQDVVVIAPAGTKLGSKVSYNSTRTRVRVKNTGTAPVDPPPPPPPPTGSYPPDVQLVAVASPAIPALPTILVPKADAKWGTQTVRITDSGRRHAYAKQQPWNSDETLMLMSFQSAMLDGKTYAFLHGVGTLPGNSNWDPTVPTDIYGTWDDSSWLWRLNVATGALFQVYDFGRRVSLGKGEGSISNNRIVPIMDFAENFTTYDLNTGKQGPWFAGGSSLGNPYDVTMSHDGVYVIVNYPDEDTKRAGIWAWHRDGTSPRQLTDMARHGDAAVDINGNQVWVSIDPRNSGVQMIRMDNGAKTVLLSDTAYGEGHVSGRNTKRPGWAYLSNYEYHSGGRKGNDLVVAVKLDPAATGNAAVEVFGWQNHRATGYEQQPHAVPSHDGSRVLFASDAGQGGGNVYDFVTGNTP